MTPLADLVLPVLVLAHLHWLVLTPKLGGNLPTSHLETSSRFGWFGSLGLTAFKRRPDVFRQGFRYDMRWTTEVNVVGVDVIFFPGKHAFKSSFVKSSATQNAFRHLRKIFFCGTSSMHTPRSSQRIPLSSTFCSTLILICFSLYVHIHTYSLEYTCMYNLALCISLLCMCTQYMRIPQRYDVKLWVNRVDVYLGSGSNSWLGRTPSTSCPALTLAPLSPLWIKMSYPINGT